MTRFLALFFISLHAWADLAELKNDQVSMIEHVGQILSTLNTKDQKGACGGEEFSQSSCSPVIDHYMKDREAQGLFKFFVDENPKELCSGVELNDTYYTSADKLDNFFQDYTYGLVPSFKSVNQGCFNKLSSIKEQNGAISYYYYAQMRLLQDGIMSLTSSAAIDKKLGRPILGDQNCQDLGRLEALCAELKTCAPGKKDLSNDIADTKMALNLKKKVEEKDAENDEEEAEKEQILGGLQALYPWIEGKEFKKHFDEEKLSDNSQSDAHIENAISKQLEATKRKLKERIGSYKELNDCVENRSSECEDFHEKLNLLAQAPVLGSTQTEQGIFARSYQNQQACINNQRNYRDSANESANEFLIGSGLTIATMGLGSVAVGSGHIIRGAHTVGALNKAQKIHRSLAIMSVQNSNKIKLGAKYLSYALNGSFTAKGVSDAVSACEEDLDHLEQFKNLVSSSNSSKKPSLCPADNQNPEFQLMSDIKSCAINAALASVDFLPAIPHGIAKYRASRPNKVNEDLLEESQWMMDPDNMKLKSMDTKYLNEDKGKAEVFYAFQNPRHDEYIPRKTKYLKSEGMRKKFQVHIRDGKLYNAEGKPLNSIEEIPGMFVVAKDGKIYFHAETDVARFHHSTFMAGEDVLGAGQISVKDGKILYIDNQSGHYKPDLVHSYQGLYHMLKAGADFSKAESKFVDFKGN